MMATDFICPHGRTILIQQSHGLKIYRHIDDGSSCSCLNHLNISPTDILLTRLETYLDNTAFLFLKSIQNYHKYENLDISYHNNLIMQEVYITFSECDNACNLFIMKLNDYAKEMQNDKFYCTCLALLLCYCQANLQVDKNKFNRKISTFINYYGQKSSTIVEIYKVLFKDSMEYSNLVNTIHFILKYEFIGKQPKILLSHAFLQELAPGQ